MTGSGGTTRFAPLDRAAADEDPPPGLPLREHLTQESVDGGNDGMRGDVPVSAPSFLCQLLGTLT